MMLFELILLNSLMYFSTMFKFKVATTLLVVMITPLLLEQIKSADTSDFTPFKSLLVFKIWMFA